MTSSSLDPDNSLPSEPQTDTRPSTTSEPAAPGAEVSPGERRAVNEWLLVGASGIHGTGGFALTRIPAETHIVEYVGERVDKEASALRCEDGNPYIFTINEEWDIDGAVDWNPARFLNHSCNPNCEAQQDEDRIWIVALRDIEPGEELTFNYGYDLASWREYPCCCGAARCRGFIVAEEHWEEVARILAAEKEAAEGR